MGLTLGLSRSKRAFFGRALRAACSVDCWRRIVRRPAVVLDFLRTAVFSVKYKDATPSEIAAVFEKTIATLAAFAEQHSPLFECTSGEFLQRGNSPSVDDVVALEALFNKYGSDKATMHDYFKIYAAILSAKRHQDMRILEVGLGTNNIDVPSNMGLHGHPGAAERAFRDWATKAQVFGADIDDRILFTEDRIQTFFVDQTKPETLQALRARFDDGTFDLVIDDGLHNSEANLNTLLALLPLLRPGGYLVVEDVSGRDRPVWSILADILAQTHLCTFIKERADRVVAIQRIS
jgi:SAM-dependent methyltransferase